MPCVSEPLPYSDSQVPSVSFLHSAADTVFCGPSVTLAIISGVVSQRKLILTAWRGTRLRRKRNPLHSFSVCSHRSNHSRLCPKMMSLPTLMMESWSAPLTRMSLPCSWHASYKAWLWLLGILRSSFPWISSTWAWVCPKAFRGEASRVSNLARTPAFSRSVSSFACEPGLAEFQLQVFVA